MLYPKKNPPQRERSFRLLETHFGASEAPVREYFAPGRVCLIGEHLDYNDGHVLPAAIAQGIRAWVRENGDSVIRLHSTADPVAVEVGVGQRLEYHPARGWGNYPAGVIHYLQNNGVELRGLDILFDADLPVGAGLSSSAAIEVLTAFLLLDAAGSPTLDREAMARLCKAVENEFVGVQCGIMDQYAVSLGRADHAMVLDCRSLSYRHVPVKLGRHKLIIMNTNKARALLASSFNQRKAECRQALSAMHQAMGVQALPEATPEAIRQHVSEPNARKRALHVVAENQRVLQAARLLEQGEVVGFGRLMNASHDSLRDFYEVSCFELDALVDAARETPGCLGARMTGAGFGGCAIALVNERHITSFTKAVGAAYQRTTGLPATFYTSVIVNGVARQA